MNSAYLWNRANSLWTKNRNISRYQNTNLLKIWSLLLVFTKGQARDKSEFVTTFAGIIVTIIFVWKSLWNSLWNLCYPVFFTDQLKRKIVKKATFRTPLANPRQLCEHQSKSFPTALIIFWGFQDFLNYFAKYFFWSHLNFPYLIFQLPFCRISVNKTV